jgi:UDP-N-acetylglucosamine diphosphorylase/glucosamine-1-phosphate N-acetyltransferase
VGEALVEADSEHVVAAVLRRADAEYLLTSGRLHELVTVKQHQERLLYRYPWDVISLMPETIPHDILATRVLEAQLVNVRDDVVGDHPVEIHESARVFPQVVFDATAGPIIVHEHAVIRPGSILCGPCAVGPGATVLDHTVIKANTVIGRASKVAGEVGATIFQGFANKAHHGHLGDSWVGEWANLGAGTTNSNLLNTYGEISMRIDPDGPMHRTGLTFLGAIIGDHVKVAINTSITTGSVFGTGAMIATSRTPPAAVRRFAWLTDRGEQRFRLEKFLSTATAMMARRDQAPSDAYVRVLTDLHAPTSGDLVDSRT